MNWITNLVRKKISGNENNMQQVAGNLWTNCPRCLQMIYQKDLDANHKVCGNCGYHFRMSMSERFSLLFDGDFERIQTKEVKIDPIKFTDTKSYKDRLKEYKEKTGEKDAIGVAVGEINSCKTVLVVFNFGFMGGSMGTAVGQGIVEAANYAVAGGLPFVIVASSGGARMQEGILSLMQMVRTTVAVEIMNEAKLPYIVVLTDPTTGGVTASFAMLGDVNIAESGCVIGFAGRRVIESTIREKLPDNFQTAEYLLEHGFVDMVVNRHDLKNRLSQVIKLLMNKHD